MRKGISSTLGVFSYSQEEGTPAASFPDQVEEAVKEERRHRLLALQARVSRRIKRARRGEICDVLVEVRTQTVSILDDPMQKHRKSMD